jgi:hypothetical protein
MPVGVPAGTNLEAVASVRLSGREHAAAAADRRSTKDNGDHMNTKRRMGCAMLSGLLSVAIPSLAHAMPGDAHDDSAYPSYATGAVTVSGPIAGPKTAAMDDASYPDAAPDELRQAGTAIASAGGPEAYGHDDASYAVPSPAPAPEPSAIGAVAAAGARVR